MPFRRSLLQRSAALAALPAPALAQSGRAATVKVGLPLAMSGPLAGIGQSISLGVRLYHKLNQPSLPAGLGIEPILRDDAGSVDNARRIAQELIVRERVQLLAGASISPQAFALASLMTQAKMPLMIMNASTASITRESPYIVRVSNTLWQSSYTMGQWAAEQGIKRVYTLAADYAAGIDAEAGFKRAFTEKGGEIVGTVRTPVAATDYLPFMQPIKGAAPEAVFMFVNAGRTNAAVTAFVGAGLRDAGVKLLGPGDIAVDDELAKMSDDVLGLVTAGVYFVNNPLPKNQEFLRAWKQEYGQESWPNFMAVAGWDGMAAIYALARETSGRFDGEAAMRFLSNWKSEDSPRGRIAIDPETRDIVQDIHLTRVEKVDGRPMSVGMSRVEAVKDPWKRLNPA